MPVNVELSVRRDFRRDKPVGETVIRDLAKRFTRKRSYLPVSDYSTATGLAQYVGYSPDRPNAVIVDLDGTIALGTQRGHYDWAKVGGDTPNQPIIDLVNDLYSVGTDQIIFLSGRKSVCRQETLDWLLRQFPYMNSYTVELYMRHDDDGRPDFIVKNELFATYVNGIYNVRLVLDDRNSVVRMWRDIGLTCLQVAPGAF